MKNLILHLKCKIIILLLAIVFPNLSLSQQIIPKWEKRELYSYCFEYDIMNHHVKGNWIVSWGSSRESLKYALSKDDITYQETDSSVIFKQDYVTHHECIFDKLNSLYCVKSHHIMTVGFGMDYSKKLQRKLAIVFGKAPMITPYDYNGVSFTWMHKNCLSGVGTTLVNYINESGYYYIYHVAERYKY